MQKRERKKIGFALNPQNINKQGFNRRFFRIQDAISDERAVMYVEALHRMACPEEQDVKPDLQAIKLLLAYKAGQPTEKVEVKDVSNSEDIFESLTQEAQEQLNAIYNKHAGIE